MFSTLILSLTVSLNSLLVSTPLQESLFSSISPLKTGNSSAETEEDYIPPDRGTPGRLEGAGTRQDRDDGEGYGYGERDSGDNSDNNEKENKSEILKDYLNDCWVEQGPVTDPFDPPGEGKPEDTVGFRI